MALFFHRDRWLHLSIFKRSNILRIKNKKVFWKLRSTMSLKLKTSMWLEDWEKRNLSLRWCRKVPLRANWTRNSLPLSALLIEESRLVPWHPDSIWTHLRLKMSESRVSIRWSSRLSTRSRPSLSSLTKLMLWSLVFFTILWREPSMWCLRISSLESSRSTSPMNSWSHSRMRIRSLRESCSSLYPITGSLLP